MRLMVEVPATAQFRAIHEAPAAERAKLTERLGRLLALPFVQFAIADRPFRSVEFQGLKRTRVRGLASRLVFSLIFANPRDMIDVAKALSGAAAAQDVTFGIDLPIAALEHWCPGRERPPSFTTQSRALSLIRAGALQEQAPPLLGEGVNVVMVDLGLNQAALRRQAPQVRFGGGWRVMQDGPGSRDAIPFQAPARGHGSMVATGLLAVSPAVTLFDLPLLPDRLGSVIPWTSWAQEVLNQVRDDILGSTGAPGLAAEYPGTWVFCHAWGVYDRRSEQPYTGVIPLYTGDPSHPLNQLIKTLAQDGFDQVFAAGNGGQFCPHPLCGPGDTGPGQSIFGAACLGEVLTVGAVRNDGMWIGYSSQGPGQPGFGPVDKPDLCTPSQFFGDDDASLLCSGTSAACGIAAGAVAALRGDGSPLAGWSSANLFAQLRNTARQPPGISPGHHARTGHGILDLGAALDGLSACTGHPIPRPPTESLPPPPPPIRPAVAEPARRAMR